MMMNYRPLIHGHRYRLGHPRSRARTRASPEDEERRIQQAMSPADILRQIARESGMRFVTSDEPEEDRESYLEALDEEENPWGRDPEEPDPATERFLTGLVLDPERPPKSAYEEAARIPVVTSDELESLLQDVRILDVSMPRRSTRPIAMCQPPNPPQVRDSAAYQTAHVPGAWSTPLQTLTRERYGGDLGPDTTGRVVIVGQLPSRLDLATKQASHHPSSVRQGSTGS